MANSKKWLLYLIPLAVGGFVAWRILGKGKSGKGKTETDTTPETDTGKSGAAASPFPLKRGSRGDEVRDLQQAIIAFGNPNLLKSGDDDGIFGSKTESALYSLLGKKSALASDIEELKARKVAADKESAKLADTASRISLAKKLISLYESKGGKFTAVAKTWVGQGKVTTDGRFISSGGGFFNVGDNIQWFNKMKLKYDANGFITIIAGEKYYFINPQSFEVKSFV